MSERYLDPDLKAFIAGLPEHEKPMATYISVQYQHQMDKAIMDGLNNHRERELAAGGPRTEKQRRIDDEIDALLEAEKDA